MKTSHIVLFYLCLFLGSSFIGYKLSKRQFQVYCNYLIQNAQDNFNYHLRVCSILGNDPNCIKNAFESANRDLKEIEDKGCSVK